MMQFRKRGMTLNSLDYKKVDFVNATCTIEFDEDDVQASKILKNLMRTVDISEIEIL